MTPPTPEQIRHLKRLLLKKGAEINAQLTDILNHKQSGPMDLLPGGKPGERPEERLRRFLDLIDGRLQAIREGRYGRCDTCGDGIPYEHLEQVPWIDTCQACAAAQDTTESP